MGWITFTVPNTRQREHHISISRTKSSPDGNSTVFFDVSGAVCIRFARKPRAKRKSRSACLASAFSRGRGTTARQGSEGDAVGTVERCLACEADAVGTPEPDALFWSNEPMGFMGRVRLIRRIPHRSHVSHKSHPFASVTALQVAADAKKTDVLPETNRLKPQ
jgi:hypothetical protein